MLLANSPIKYLFFDCEGGLKRDALSCGLARPHGFTGGKPIQVTVSHGPGIEPCRRSGNTGSENGVMKMGNYNKVYGGYPG